MKKLSKYGSHLPIGGGSSNIIGIVCGEEWEALGIFKASEQLMQVVTVDFYFLFTVYQATFN